MSRAVSDPPAGPRPLAHDPTDQHQGTLVLWRWLLATAVAMFPLIWFGGLTTSHGAGLAVPDWPNTYGYNMFAVPFSVWLSESAGGIFLEHTHRLLGSVTGLLAVAATLAAWGPSRNAGSRKWWGRVTLILALLALVNFVLMRFDIAGKHRLFGHAASLNGGFGVITALGWQARTREPRRWVRWGTTALLGMIIVQGVLGGLRVTEVNLELAIVHGIFAQATFCFAGFLVLACSRWWQSARSAVHEAANCHDASRLLAISAAVTLLVFAQLTVAAVMRHYQAGLAVPDFPLSYGRLVPPMSAAALEPANELRAYELSLPPTTLGLIWLHTAHRIGALIITATIGWLVWTAVRARGTARPLGHVGLLAGLLLVQLGLGMTTIWMRKPADVATAHVAVGALLLLTAWLLTVRLWRARALGNGLPHQNGPDHGQLALPRRGEFATANRTASMRPLPRSEAVRRDKAPRMSPPPPRFRPDSCIIFGHAQ